MSTKVNKVRNAAFSQGKETPRFWNWSTESKGSRWRRQPVETRMVGDAHPTSARGSKEVEVMTIITRGSKGSACWSQVIACKPGEFYRVEADVSCDLTAKHDEAGDGRAGLVIEVQPMVNSRPRGEKRVTPGLLRASEPIAIRAYYEAPENVRQVRLAVGVRDARGTVRIQQVRWIRVIEPDEESHILAIPAPPFALPPPRVAKKICLCSAAAHERTLGSLLAGYFDEANVQRLSPDQLQADALRADALLLSDPTPPPSIRTLRSLLALAQDRIVVISLPAFTKLSPGSLSLRRIEQDDDPIHAKNVYASYATRGFALHDVFPYAWSGQTAGSFVQNHFRRTEKLKAFCKKHGFETLLVSMCDQDVTSDRPICLFKETTGGGLFVLDVEPVEAIGSTFNEPALAMHLLLNILGQTQNSLGQYVSPVRREHEIRQFIRDMPERFSQFVVHEEDLPIKEVTEQLITIGRDDQSFGLPIKPKPVILVRSGLSAGDAESVYGAFVWFKQLIRMAPHVCPYAEALASRFRLAWTPLSASWESRDGWRRTSQPPEAETTIVAEADQIAAMIDVAACSPGGVGLVLPSHEGEYRRYYEWMPRLLAAFPLGRYYMPYVDTAQKDGPAAADRDRFAWRHVEHDLQVVVDPDIFHSRAHQDVMRAGGKVIRIEIPAGDADFTACSIQRTDLTATLLETVIGLQYGLIGVNRSLERVSFDGFPPVASGEALIVPHDHPIFESCTVVQAG